MNWNGLIQFRPLLSAGLDHNINVYNTYVKEKLYTLNGHNNPIVSVKSIPRSYQICSADIGGIIKIWDYRNWECV